MHDVLLLLGSNIEKERMIPAAVAGLRSDPNIDVIRVSATYATPAIGADGAESAQPTFHNVAVYIRTSIAPDVLRARLRGLERRLGRVRSEDKFAPRPIDIDISLFGEQILDLDGCAIPDPDIARFPHIAIPLAEIAPDRILPTTGERLDTIAARLAHTETEMIRL